MTRIVDRCTHPRFVVSAAILATVLSTAPSWAMGARGDISQASRGAGAATTSAAPEIGAGAAGMALALVAGGLAILRSRRR